MFREKSISKIIVFICALLLLVFCKVSLILRVQCLIGSDIGCLLLEMFCLYLPGFLSKRIGDLWILIHRVNNFLRMERYIAGDDVHMDFA